MAAATDAERIARREARLTVVLAEKAELEAGGLDSRNSSTRDHQLLAREEAQIREELAALRARSS